MQRIAIFASGSGTNAENLIKSFQNTEIQVVKVFCNNQNAGVIERANRLNVPVMVFSRSDFYESTKILDELQSQSVDFVILAGFMMLIPTNILVAFEGKIVNIHPALLPKYGGKGMYGHHVHEAVIANHEVESGITIHLVNEEYDRGEHLFQATCAVLETDTPDSLAARVHELEYKYFPEVVRNFVLK